MNLTRYQERLDDFRAAFSRLREGLAIAVDELDRDGVIQRFEFTFEMSWKVMKIWLDIKGIRVANPKDTFQEGVANGLILDGNLWSDLQKCRNLTSHTYDQINAQIVFDKLKLIAVPAFQSLLEILEKRSPA